MGYVKQEMYNNENLKLDLKNKMFQVIQSVYTEKTEEELKELSDESLRGLYGSAVKKYRKRTITFDDFEEQPETLDPYAIPDEEIERNYGRSR